MSHSPLTKVCSPAFPQGPALSTKKISQKSAQSQLSPQAVDLQQTLEKYKTVQQQKLTQSNLNIQSSNSTSNLYQPNNQFETAQKKRTEPNENIEHSPANIINIYSYDQQHNKLFQDIDLVATYHSVQQVSNKKNQYGNDQNSNEQKTYNKMTNEEAEKMYGQRQKVIKSHIARQKNTKKSKNSQPLKGVLKKSNIQDQSVQSSQIDLSRTSCNLRRKSIDHPIKTIPAPIQQESTLVHNQLSQKKRLLLTDIAKLDKEIKQIEKFAIKQYPETSRQRGPVLYQKGMMQEDRKYSQFINERQLRQKIAEREKISKEMEECTFKPQISTTSRKLNASMKDFRPRKMTTNSQATPQTSPKQQIKAKQQRGKNYPRSFSQDEFKQAEVPLNHKRAELNLRLDKMNEKYQAILDQANKIKAKLNV